MRTWTVIIVAWLSLSLAPCCDAQPNDWCVDLDQITAVAHDSTITVFHTAAFYNCCPVDIAYSMQQVGNTFVLYETEIEPQCLCLCCFNLSVDIEHVAPGNYLVEFHWDDYDGGPEVRYVPVTVPDVGQMIPAELGDRIRSACLNAADAADGSAGTRGAPILEPASPNPMTTETRFHCRLPDGAAARLAIYSAAGTQVRTLVASGSEGELRRFSWDGRDASGRVVPAGIYFARLTTLGGAATQPVIVIR